MDPFRGRDRLSYNAPYRWPTICRPGNADLRHTSPAFRRAWIPAASRRPCSAADGALSLDVERIDRLALSHEEAVALDAAETDVGAALGQHDAADHLAVGGEDGNAVLGLATGPCAPQITVDIDPHAVGPARFGAVELTPVRGLGVVDDIVDLNRALPWSRRVDDVEQVLVGRKSEPVGPPHVADRNCQLAGRRVEAVDPVR